MGSSTDGTRYRQSGSAPAVPPPGGQNLGRLIGCLMAAILLVTAACYAQTPDPITLVKRASFNELHAGSGGRPYRYRLHRIDDGKITTKIIVETKEGDVARLVETDDKPLSDEANRVELARLQNLYDHPEVQERRHKREQSDSTNESEMVRLLPDAFLYKYQGMVPGPNGPAYRLSFQPNPSYAPPDREAEAFKGMEGELWIDKGEERMVKLDAHLIADVNFGWGILGKLYKGGSILVEQKDVGDRHWEATHMVLNLTGKALMLKSLSFQTTEDGSDFHPVPDAGYKAAIELLRTLK